jgi:ferritin-like metal-binding protein YciE
LGTYYQAKGSAQSSATENKSGEKNLNDLFYDTLKDIYFAERQILKTLPKLAKAAKSAELKTAFLTHRDETEEHVERLQASL